MVEDFAERLLGRTGCAGKVAPGVRSASPCRTTRSSGCSVPSAASGCSSSGAAPGRPRSRSLVTGATVIGIDESPASIADARAAAEAAEVKLELRAGDLADLAFLRADSMDMACSQGALAPRRRPRPPVPAGPPGAPTGGAVRVLAPAPVHARHRRRGRRPRARSRSGAPPSPAPTSTRRRSTSGPPGDARRGAPPPARRGVHRPRPGGIPGRRPPRARAATHGQHPPAPPDHRRLEGPQRRIMSGATRSHRYTATCRVVGVDGRGLRRILAGAHDAVRARADRRSP